MAVCFCDSFPQMVRCASVKNAMLSADENRPLLRTLLQREFWNALKEHAGTNRGKQCPVCRPPSCEADESGLGDEDEDAVPLEEDEQEPQPVAEKATPDAEQAPTCLSASSSTLTNPSTNTDTTTAPTTAPQCYNPMSCDFLGIQKHQEAGFRGADLHFKGGVSADVTQPSPASDSLFSSSPHFIYASLPSGHQIQPV
eukprot:m.225513 g.225513  ORF g.225513 m.225513 type:complete len:198 (-) comp16708_c0_seq1:246-839(-)